MWSWVGRLYSYPALPTTACRRRSIGVTIGTVSIVLATAINRGAVKVSRVMTALSSGCWQR